MKKTNLTPQQVKALRVKISQLPKQANKKQVQNAVESVLGKGHPAAAILVLFILLIILRS